MGLPISIYVADDIVEYFFEIYRKVTVISGFSGTGKSTLCRMIQEKAEERGYKEKISDCRYHLEVIQQASMDTMISGILHNSSQGKKRYVVFLDDFDCIVSKQFIELFKTDVWNFYVIINRYQNTERKLSSIPFSIYSVYSMESSGRKHWLEPKYNITLTENDDYDCVITEDSSQGYKFLLNFNNNISTAKGKDNIVKVISNNSLLLEGKRVLVFADLASYGASIGNLISTIKFDVSISFVENYECFEYLLMNSSFLSKDEKVCFALQQAKDINTLVQYQSHEKMYEDLIKKATDGKPYRVKHGLGARLSNCYIKDCCSTKPCKIEQIGDKRNLMFRQTPWQNLFECIQNSSLIKIE